MYFTFHIIVKKEIKNCSEKFIYRLIYIYFKALIQHSIALVITLIVSEIFKFLYHL